MISQITRSQRSLIDLQGVAADGMNDGLRAVEEAIVQMLDVHSDDVEHITMIRRFVHTVPAMSLEQLLDELKVTVEG
jgi:hypothetical protein